MRGGVKVTEAQLNLPLEIWEMVLLVFYVGTIMDEISGVQMLCLSSDKSTVTFLNYSRTLEQKIRDNI